QVLAFGLMTLYLSVVNVALQPQVSGQAVGPHRVARLDRLGDKAVQAGFGHIGDMPQADAADALPVFLGRDSDQGFLLRLSPNDALFLTAPVGLVHLDRSPQAVP